MKPADVYPKSNKEPQEDRTQPETTDDVSREPREAADDGGEQLLSGMPREQGGNRDAKPKEILPPPHASSADAE